MNVTPSQAIETDNAFQSTHDLYAAIDLGSNSFHMVVSRYEHEEFVVVDRHRSTVRLAAGLDEEGNLTPAAQERALATLEQFSQLLRDIPSTQIRAVGTNAMRRMKNGNAFTELAEKALGTQIEIIAGREEARLIYLGVIKGAEFSQEGNDELSRLVVDIGGGSTEVIVGDGDKPKRRESLEMGCVVLSQQFFSDGLLSKTQFEKAILEAELAIQPVAKLFKTQGWQHAIGCSGTIRALANMLESMGWAKGEITKTALDRLLTFAVEAGSLKALDLPGLNDDRRPVFGGGLSVLIAVFEVLGIERMQVSDQALRDGVLYDLIGRSSENDVRDVAVNALIERFAVDVRHARFVKSTASKIYADVATSWDIESVFLEKMLSWSALTHEIGMLISHDGYHKHGAYLLTNADMVGFARRDQAVLACLIKGHRGKFPWRDFEDLPASLVTPAKRLAAILRLSVLLHRTRSTQIPEEFYASVNGTKLTLHFPDGWLNAHPLTQGDLVQEQKRLSAIAIDLVFKP